MIDEARVHARARLREQRHAVHEGSTLRRVGPIRRRRVRVRDPIDGRDVVLVLPDMARRHARPARPALSSAPWAVGVVALPAPRVERRYLLAGATALAAVGAMAAAFLVQAGSDEPPPQPAMVVWGTVEPEPTAPVAGSQAGAEAPQPRATAPDAEPATETDPEPTPVPTAEPTPEPAAFADGFSAQIHACRSLGGSRCQGPLDIVEGGQFVVLVQLEKTKAGDVMTSHLVGPSGSTQVQRFVVQRGGGGYMYTTVSAASFAPGDYRLVAQRNGTTVSERPLRIGG